MLKSKVSSFLLPLFALLLLFSIVTLMQYISLGKWPIFNDCICRWDCGWYARIKLEGYSFWPGKQSTVAFFPTFPYLWKITGFSNWGISIANALIFSFGCFLASMHFKYDVKTLVAFLSFGLIGFFAVPYSESLFFLGVVMLLIGLEKHNPFLLLFGTGLSVTSRSAAMLFLVAFIMLLVLYVLKYKSERHAIRSLIVAIFGTVFFTLLVFTVHFKDTGRFLGFFEAQQHWNHKLSLPGIPLSAWSWPSPLSDSIALLFGISAGILIIQSLFFDITKRKINFSPFAILTELTLAESFSLLYLAGTTATILLFQGGDIHSINRYVFSTPFFLMFIHLFVVQKVTFKLKVWHYVIVCLILKQALPRDHYIEHYIVLLFGLIFLTLGIFKIHSIKFKKINLWYGLAGLAFAFQIYMFIRFIQGNWMG